MTKIISAQKVAERLNKSIPTIWRWCREGEIPHRRINPRTLLFDEQEIEQWIESKARGPQVIGGVR